MDYFLKAPAKTDYLQASRILSLSPGWRQSSGMKNGVAFLQKMWS